MSKTQIANLNKQATMFLRQHGFTWAGRPKGQADGAQHSFERKLLVNAVGTRR